MLVRSAEAEWSGSLANGEGRLKVGSGSFEGSYSYSSRIGNGAGTNPEELIGAAHAGCFAMALASILAEDGIHAERVRAKADVHLDHTNGVYSISRIDLSTDVVASGLDEITFREYATMAARTCPVSKALAGVGIQLTAKLLSPAATPG